VRLTFSEVRSGLLEVEFQNQPKLLQLLIGALASVVLVLVLGIELYITPNWIRFVNGVKVPLAYNVGLGVEKTRIVSYHAPFSCWNRRAPI
jgi:hypothetical protein